MFLIVLFEYVADLSLAQETLFSEDGNEKTETSMAEKEPSKRT